MPYRHANSVPHAAGTDGIAGYPQMRAPTLSNLAAVSLVALILLCLAWEIWLAPLRPGGSWLMLKALPLLAPLPGILRRRRYTFQWSSMLILAYFAEGVVRSASETGMSFFLALIETALSVLFFYCVITYSSLTRHSATTNA
jgi:uncharacterized membrane protein